MNKLEYLHIKYPYKPSGKWFIYKLGKHLLLSPYTFRQLKFHIKKKKYEILGTFKTADDARKVLNDKYPNWTIQDPTREYPIKPNHYTVTEKVKERYKKHSEFMKGENNPNFGGFSEEHLANLRKANAKGMRKKPRKTAKLKRKYKKMKKLMAGKNNPMYGTKWNENQKRARQEYLRYHSKEGIFHHMYGKHHSDKAKAKISATKKGKIWVTDTEGKIHLKPKDFVLPFGWFRGRPNQTIKS